MRGFIKIPLILALLIGVIIAAYLYISRAEDVTKLQQTSENAGDIIDNAQQLQNQTEEAQNRANNIQNQLYD